jgi:hypothetical protein
VVTGRARPRRLCRRRGRGRDHHCQAAGPSRVARRLCGTGLLGKLDLNQCAPGPDTKEQLSPGHLGVAEGSSWYGWSRPAESVLSHESGGSTASRLCSALPTLRPITRPKGAAGHPLDNCRRALKGNLWPSGVPALGVKPLVVLAGGRRALKVRTG